jgi:hypothetical protein
MPAREMGTDGALWPRVQILSLCAAKENCRHIRKRFRHWALSAAPAAFK